MTKGWHKEPTRHALASKGIQTTRQHTARAVGVSNLIARYSGNNARRIVDKILLRDDEIRPKLPPYYNIGVVKIWKGGTLEFSTLGDYYILNVDDEKFDEILYKIGELDL